MARIWSHISRAQLLRKSMAIQAAKKERRGLMADFISLHVHKRKNIYSLKFSFSRPEVAPFIFTISFT